MGYALLDGTCVSSMINKEYTLNGYRFITQFDNGWISIRFLDDVPTNCINQFSNIGAFNDYIEYLKRKPHHDDYLQEQRRITMDKITSDKLFEIN